MSFIAIDQRASRVRSRASAFEFVVVPDAFLSKALGTSGDSPDSGWLTKIALGLISILLPCVLAAIVITHRIDLPDLAPVTSEMYPTCSFERDCWIAPAPVPKQSGRAAGPDLHAATIVPAPVSHPAADNGQGQTAEEFRAASFGALVVPATGWSGAIPAPKASKIAQSGSAHRLSAAVAQASSRLGPSVKQAKPQASTSKHGTGSNQRTARAQAPSAQVSD